MIIRIFIIAIFAKFIVNTVASGAHYFHDSKGEWFLEKIYIATDEISSIQTKSTELAFKLEVVRSVSAITITVGTSCAFLLKTLNLNALYIVKALDSTTVSLTINDATSNLTTCQNITNLSFHVTFTGLVDASLSLLLSPMVPVEIPREATALDYKPLEDIATKRHFSADISFITACCALGLMACAGFGLLLFICIRYCRKRIKSERNKTSPPDEDASKTGEKVASSRNNAELEEKTCTARSFDIASPISPSKLNQKGTKIQSTKSEKLKQLALLHVTTPKNSYDELRQRFPDEVEYLAALAGDGPRISQSGSLDRTDLINDLPD